MSIVIEPISIDDVIANNPKRYNSNNHSQIMPSDYYTILSNGNTSNWINKFKKGYIIIQIQMKDLDWMKKAHDIGKFTGKFPSMFQEELDIVLELYKDIDYIFKNGQKYFVRAERVSFKTGMHGPGPYTSLKQIFESLVTCTDNLCPLNMKYTSMQPLKNISEDYLKLYLMPWIEIDPDKEFIIFVYNNKITAISQQNIYRSNTILKPYQNIKNVIIKEWIQIITSYFETTIKSNITHTQNYTIDLAILDNDKPYFIEINSFGKDYAAGSALFHWIIDEDILLDTKLQNKIYFRYVE